MAVGKILHIFREKLCMLGSWRLPAGVRTLTTTPRMLANHYDVLGITPKATQSDIKSAYYKLSKVHHPDKSDDEASAKKFREISEAYEVLGNVRLKKMYDKGLIVGRENKSRMDYEPEPEPMDPTVKFYKSRTTRHVAPTMDGRTPIYDFDAWSKNHYGDLFAKSQRDKEVLRRRIHKQKVQETSGRQEALIYMLFALGGLFVMLVVHGREDYDRNTLTSSKSHLKENKSADEK
ncbi:dnaJ domain-containing protein [Phthorimaea operculella]|nr:dnaJ domain-containing protein [Phthorimaea operculella]